MEHLISTGRIRLFRDPMKKNFSFFSLFSDLLKLGLSKLLFNFGVCVVVFFFNLHILRLLPGFLGAFLSFLCQSSVDLCSPLHQGTKFTFSLKAQVLHDLQEIFWRLGDWEVFLFVLLRPKNLIDILSLTAA